MPLRNILLSGFQSSDPNGKILIESTILTPQANTRTAAGRLSWADVRFLDDAFRKAPPSWGNVSSNINYLRDSNLQKSAGRHLYSILTGRFIFYGPNDLRPQDPKVITKKPRMEVEGGMSFPNEQSLFGYQVDSDYGKLCQGWLNYLRFNQQLPAPPGVTKINQMLASYLRIIQNSSLSQIDRNDVYALCVLHAWASNQFAGATSIPLASLAAPPIPSQVAILMSMSSRQKALDIGRTLTGFSTFFNISGSFGRNAFPE